MQLLVLKVKFCMNLTLISRYIVLSLTTPVLSSGFLKIKPVKTNWEDPCNHDSKSQNIRF